MYDRADLDFGWSDRGSDRGTVAGSDCGDGLPENWELYRYHRMIGHRLRLFRLVLLGTTKPPGGSCALCDYCEIDEDPLCPGYQVEWAYYKVKSPCVKDGEICY